MGLGKIKKKINKEKKENQGSKPKIIRTDIKKEFGIINLDKDRINKSGGGPILKNPNKADLDKSENLSSYEKKRGEAIEKSMGLKSGGLALKGYGKAYMKGGKVK
tara:strand:- start:149 stop:463 length:315 start_codon:yes stop_codon:yes gene_type:complete